MNYHNYEKVSDYKVQEWLEISIVEMTPYQKERLRNDEIIRFAPFEFYQRRKQVKYFWIRLSVILMPIVWLLLFISLPFCYLVTGRWGYRYEAIKWFDKWRNAVGL